MLKLRPVIILILFMDSCVQSYDPELVQQDGFGHSRLTVLGCLTNGPWEIDDSSLGYNTKLCIDDIEELSKATPYTDIQKNLVFELHKGGTLSFWFKNEIGSTKDTIIKNNTVTVIQKAPEKDQLKKIYTDGYWKVNYNDSLVYIDFAGKIPSLKFKYSALGNGFADFQEINFIDTVYSGRKTILKKITTLHYTTQFPIF